METTLSLEQAKAMLVDRLPTCKWIEVVGTARHTGPTSIFKASEFRIDVGLDGDPVKFTVKEPTLAAAMEKSLRIIGAIVPHGSRVLSEPAPLSSLLPAAVRKIEDRILKAADPRCPECGGETGPAHAPDEDAVPLDGVRRCIATLCQWEGDEAECIDQAAAMGMRNGPLPAGPDLNHGYVAPVGVAR